MLFIDWSMLATLLIALVAISGAIAVIWAVRKKKLLIKIPVIVSSVPFGLLGTLALLLMALGQIWGCETHEDPIYSPDGKSAARVETWDAGATGGGTDVLVYADHGFRVNTVLSGNWRFVGAGDVEWLDNSHLLIRYDHYDGYDEAKSCRSTRAVDVKCEARLP